VFKFGRARSVPWQAWIGSLLSVVCLIAVIRGLNWRIVWSTLQVANGYWLSLALVATLASIPARAIRWAVLLACPHLPMDTLVSAILIGQAANYVAPIRVGELIRAYLVGRNTPLSAAQVLGSIAVEKAWDVLVLLLIAVALVTLVTLPAWFAASAVGMALGLGAGVLISLVALSKRDALTALVRRWMAHLPGRAAQQLPTRLDQLLNGLEVFRRPSVIVLAAGCSLLVWTLSAATTLGVMRALGVPSLPAGLFLLAVLMLGNSVPSAPGAIGVVEGLTVVALGVFGIEYNAAFSVGIVLHAVSYIPPLILSALALWYEGRRGIDVRVAWQTRQ
jgi:uncharacterized protein (TIRG00374 family)